MERSYTEASWRVAALRVDRARAVASHGSEVTCGWLGDALPPVMPEVLIPKLAEPQKRGPKPTGRTSDAERQRRSRAERQAAAEHAKERAKESV